MTLGVRDGFTTLHSSDHFCFLCVLLSLSLPCFFSFPLPFGVHTFPHLQLQMVYSYVGNRNWAQHRWHSKTGAFQNRAATIRVQQRWCRKGKKARPELQLRPFSLYAPCAFAFAAQMRPRAKYAWVSYPTEEFLFKSLKIFKLLNRKSSAR